MNVIVRMRRGFAAAARRQRELDRAEGARSAQAIAEALAASEALAAAGEWPAPRDPVNERAVEEALRARFRFNPNASNRHRIHDDRLPARDAHDEAIARRV